MKTITIPMEAFNKSCDQIKILTEENLRLKKHSAAIPASKSLNPPKQINESNFAFWGMECDV